MDKKLETICEDFVEKRDMLREIFKREGMAMHLMGAALLTDTDDAPDKDALLECEKVLKKHEGIFSPFRGALKLPVVVNMATSDDPEEYLKRVRECYDLICGKMRSRNERYYLQAMELAAEAGSDEDIEKRFDSGRDMSGDISGENEDLDAMIASLGIDEEELETEIEDAYGFLDKQKGFGLNGSQAEMKRMYAKMLVCMAHGHGQRAAFAGVRHALDDALRSRFRA